MDNETSLVKEHFRKTQLVPFCIVMVVGILANTMVIVNGIRRRSTISHCNNYFVLSMALADLGVVVFQVPVAIFEYTFGIPNITHFVCKYIFTIRETFQGAAIFSVSFLAFVRVRKVMSYPNKSISKCTCIILIAGIWVMSFLLCSLPLFFVYKVLPDGQCSANWSNNTFKRVLLCLIAFLILLPMIPATISYGYIILKMRNAFASAPNSDIRRRNRNVTMLLISLILSSWISYVPMAVFIVVALDTNDVDFYVWSIASILYISGSALNPLLVLINMPREYCCHVQCRRVPRITDAALIQVRTDTSRLRPGGVKPSCSLQSMKEAELANESV